ncbi:type II toxin-antitoxin system YafQ family toxin [Helicobacter sp. MIT 00-7814]|uniref:type II toxin-antitoxin system YafQ family toxin n=1 Tax=unclassified Helicobacter TaxID=2593540 RepID=UPI000E1EE50C|nr:MULTISPECIES: type II toxin-antitoxin system YafQ family toxin [unclassified Helicobacter]RDU54351.1 type II toxin-antitoxin system YafQ family toxin [Helicobacter sp. MIT 99-10781]RDU54428.1 type II toxin-antitoxin system YafQ family toxin [Helicobacter sp. MIT 00-7814]
MEYEIRISKEYKKNYKKLTLYEKDLVDEIVCRLSKNEILEKKYKDHKLKGEFKDYRECHIKPDLLLVYQKQDNILVLTCINVGSHSELF